MPELIHDVPASALAIYAHPDDPEVSCGGTLARWASAGCAVHVVVCMLGDKGSSDPAVDSGELAARRAEEMAAAADVLGLRGHHALGHPDGEIENTVAVRGQLVVLIRQLAPEVVICPDPTAVFFGPSYFNHHDHRAVGWAALDAVSPAAAQPHYFPDAGAAHRVATVYLSGTLEPDVWVDISDTVDVKAQALLCHKSQIDETAEWMRTVVRERAEDAGRAAGVACAEGFRRFSPAG